MSNILFFLFPIFFFCKKFKMLKNDKLFTNIKWSPIIFCSRISFSWKAQNFQALASVGHLPNRNTFCQHILDFSMRLTHLSLLKSMNLYQCDHDRQQQLPSNKWYCQLFVLKLEVLISHRKMFLLGFPFSTKVSFIHPFSFLSLFFSKNHINLLIG